MGEREVKLERFARLIRMDEFTELKDYITSRIKYYQGLQRDVLYNPAFTLDTAVRLQTIAALQVELESQLRYFDNVVKDTLRMQHVS